ncbi:MAG: TatD family hydrolase [Eubacteriaceae bacterium]|nr:TatD family hydrolase [Eubacteriaceae bacterium]
MTGLFDAHAHLTDDAFDAILDSLLDKMKQDGMMALVTAYDALSCKESIELAASCDGLFAACGLHPNEAASYSDEFEYSLRQMLQFPKSVAVGEAGLDYHWDTCPRDMQWHVFERQIALAAELRKPIVVHIRDAAGDAFSLIRASAQPGQTFVLHAFSQSEEMAEQYMLLPIECYFSLAGPLTYKNAERLRATASRLPHNRVLIETDCPYLPPVPYRGKTNTPLLLPFVCEALAKALHLGVDETAELTKNNALRAFGLLNI